METSVIHTRLRQIFSSHSQEEIFSFVETYAYENQTLALALIDAFGTVDPSDVKTLVERCFIHPATSPYLGVSLDWYAIGEDLGHVFQKASTLPEGRCI